MVELHAAKTGQPTYLYRYAYRAQWSLSNMMANNQENYGVSHADDVLPLFHYMGAPVEVNKQDVQMRDSLLEMLYSFASTGVPKVPNGPQWLEVQRNSPELNYLEIDAPNNIEMRSSSDFGHRSFWDSLGFLENENYHVNVRDEL